MSLFVRRITTKIAGHTAQWNQTSKNQKTLPKQSVSENQPTSEMGRFETEILTTRKNLQDDDGRAGKVD